VNDRNAWVSRPSNYRPPNAEHLVSTAVSNRHTRPLDVTSDLRRYPRSRMTVGAPTPPSDTSLTVKTLSGLSASDGNQRQGAEQNLTLRVVSEGRLQPKVHAPPGAPSWSPREAKCLVKDSRQRLGDPV
jgi:hypothetical protein